jgi:hypothetical protein
MGQLDWVQLAQKPDPEIWQGWVSEAAARKIHATFWKVFHGREAFR